MAPIEANQQTGRARRWKRALRIVDQPVSWARDSPVSNNVKRFPGPSRGRARVVIPRQNGVGAGAGAGTGAGRSPDEVPSRGRGPNQGGVESESEDDILSDGSISDDSADELDGDISDSESEDDGIDSDIDSPPATPISGVSPTLTPSDPGVGATATSAVGGAPPIMTPMIVS